MEDLIFKSHCGRVATLRTLGIPHTSGSIQARRLPKTVDFSTVKSWIQGCLDAAQVVGLRLIDCTDLAALRITVAEEALPKYVTLSYVWGIDKEGPTSTKNRLLIQMPKTVQDAAYVVNSLGHQYLWVDRYCIEQSNEAQKHEIISRMGDVYANSELTLVATAGVGASSGLPGVGSPRTETQHFINIRSKQYVLVQDTMKETVEKSTWNQRGWTFQEALLSRRMLVFTSRCVYSNAGISTQ